MKFMLVRLNPTALFDLARAPHFDLKFAESKKGPSSWPHLAPTVANSLGIHIEQRKDARAAPFHDSLARLVASSLTSEFA